jgi:1,2-diacylglycerol 3-beta-galactosyltransferase
MPSTSRDRAHILFLFSDTGGGHRSAARAIIEALNLEYEGKYATEMVDIFKAYAPIPFNRMPDLYPRMVRLPRAWGLGYRLSDGRRRSRLVMTSLWPYVRRAVKSLVEHHPSDLIVSVHPLANASILQALGERRPPFTVIVTDLVTTHAFWFDRRVDLCVVPTEPAYRRALAAGLAPGRLRQVGLPVADRFSQPLDGPTELRERLGWPKDRPVVLMVGGGEGMGPLEEIALEVDRAGLPISLVVVTGRNQRLEARLTAHAWSCPVRIYGFVDTMPEFMNAADILVTKAGPGTISEAFTAGLPLILYSRLPGQEDGNVSYVVSRGAGVWAPNPDQVVMALARWVMDPVDRQRAAKASQQLARPDAARQIAHILVRQIASTNPGS